MQIAPKTVSSPLELSDDAGIFYALRADGTVTCDWPRLRKARDEFMAGQMDDFRILAAAIWIAKNE